MILVVRVIKHGGKRLKNSESRNRNFYFCKAWISKYIVHFIGLLLMQFLENKKEIIAEGKQLCLNEQDMAILCQVLIGLPLIRRVKAQSCIIPRRNSTCFCSSANNIHKYDHSKVLKCSF